MRRFTFIILFKICTIFGFSNHVEDSVFQLILAKGRVTCFKEANSWNFYTVAHGFSAEDKGRDLKIERHTHDNYGNYRVKIFYLKVDWIDVNHDIALLKPVEVEIEKMKQEGLLESDGYVIARTSILEKGIRKIKLNLDYIVNLESDFIECSAIALWNAKKLNNTLIQDIIPINKKLSSLKYNSGTIHGLSGSPVYFERESDKVVVGIHRGRQFGDKAKMNIAFGAVFSYEILNHCTKLFEFTNLDLARFNSPDLQNFIDMMRNEMFYERILTFSRSTCGYEKDRYKNFDSKIFRNREDWCLRYFREFWIDKERNDKAIISIVSYRKEGYLTYAYYITLLDLIDSQIFKDKAIVSEANKIISDFRWEENLNTFNVACKMSNLRNCEILFLNILLNFATQKKELIKNFRDNPNIKCAEVFDQLGELEKMAGKLKFMNEAIRLKYAEKNNYFNPIFKQFANSIDVDVWFGEFAENMKLRIDDYMECVFKFEHTDSRCYKAIKDSLSDLFEQDQCIEHLTKNGFHQFNDIIQNLNKKERDVLDKSNAIEGQVLKFEQDLVAVNGLVKHKFDNLNRKFQTLKIETNYHSDFKQEFRSEQHCPQLSYVINFDFDNLATQLYSTYSGFPLSSYSNPFTKEFGDLMIQLVDELRRNVLVDSINIIALGMADGHPYRGKFSLSSFRNYGGINFKRKDYPILQSVNQVPRLNPDGNFSYQIDTLSFKRSSSNELLGYYRAYELVHGVFDKENVKVSIFGASVDLRGSDYRKAEILLTITLKDCDEISNKIIEQRSIEVLDGVQSLQGCELGCEFRDEDIKAILRRSIERLK